MSVGGGGGTRVAELEILIRADGSQAESEIAGVSRTFHNLIAGGALMQAGRGVLDWFKGAITSGAAFEQTMIRIDQLTTGSAVGVDALTKKAFEVDQMTIYSAQQIAEAMEQLAREGFSGEELLGGWTDAAVNFAAVINEDLTQSANILGQVARIFKREGLDAAETADIISQSILRSGRPAVEFMTGMQYIGGIATQIGVPLEEVATTLSYLQSVGIRGRSAGTGLRSMFLELATGADEFGMSHGVQAFDPVTGAFVGMPKIIDQFHQLIQGMSKAEGLSLVESIFGKPAASPLYQLFADGVEAYEEHNEKMTSLGTAANFMKKLMDTIAGSLDRFEAASSNLARSLGVLAGVMIRPLLDVATIFISWLTDLPDIVKVATLAVAGLTGALMMLTGAFMIFRGLGGFAMLFSMFKMMSVMSVGAALGIGLIVGAMVLFRDKIGGWTDSVREALGPIANILEYLSNVTHAQNPVAEFLKGMDDGPLKKFAIGAGRVVEAFRDLWYFIGRGDWSRFWRRLPGELRQAAGGFDIIFDALGDVDWSEKIKNALQWTGENIVFPMVVATFEVGLDLIGTAAQWAGNIWGWIKSKVFPEQSRGSGMLSALTGSTSDLPAEGSQTIPFGTIFVEAGLALAGEAAAAAGNLWGWIKANLQVGGTTSTTMTGTGLYNDSGDQIYQTTQTQENTVFMGTVFVDGMLAMGEGFVNSFDAFMGEVISAVSNKINIEEDGLSIGPIKIRAVPEWHESIWSYLGNLLQVSPEMAEKIATFAESFGEAVGTALSHILTMDVLNEDSTNFAGPSESEWEGAFAVFAENFVKGFRNAISNKLKRDILDFLNEDILGFWNEIIGLMQHIPGLGRFYEDRELIAYLDENGNMVVSTLEDYYAQLNDDVSQIDPTINVPDPKFVKTSPEDLWASLKIPNFNEWMPENPGRSFSQEDLYLLGRRGSHSYQSGGGGGAPGGTGGTGGGPLNDLAPIGKVKPNEFLDPSFKELEISAKFKLDTESALESLSKFGISSPTAKSFGDEPVMTAQFAIDLKDAVEKYAEASRWGEVWNEQTFAADFDIDLGNAALRYTDAFTWGEAWANAVFESTFTADNGPAALKYTDAYGWGDTWALAVFMSTFDIDNGPAAVKYTDAFGWGDTWAAQTFTARFSVDLSPLEAAAQRAVQLAQIISDHMPHSPARKGPLKEPISFQYISDDFNAMADAIAARARSSADIIAGSLAGPRRTSTPDVTMPTQRTVVNNYFALTAEDLGRLQQEAQNGSLNLAEADRELRMSLGMV